MKEARSSWVGILSSSSFFPSLSSPPSSFPSSFSYLSLFVCFYFDLQNRHIYHSSRGEEEDSNAGQEGERKGEGGQEEDEEARGERRGGRGRTPH